MTIDFICEELAELFDSPCNYSPMDEKMFQDSYCESHCGKITDKECWKRYFEKVWADRKTNSSEIPNNCDDADIFEYCPRCGMRILVDKPKTEPQTDYMKWEAPPKVDLPTGEITTCVSVLASALDTDCPTCRYNSDEWDSPKCDGCSKANSHYEPQTDCSWK